jgi:hypothetical protein
MRAIFLSGYLNLNHPLDAEGVGFAQNGLAFQMPFALTGFVSQQMTPSGLLLDHDFSCPRHLEAFENALFSFESLTHFHRP